MTEPLNPATAEFGARVKAARLALGISQEKLAERAGLHWSYTGQIERGLRNVAFGNLLNLAAALEVTPGELLDGIDPPD